MTQNLSKLIRFGIIDIGSVAIRSEIYSVFSNNTSRFELVYSKSYLPKLGKLNDNNEIIGESIGLAQDFLLEIIENLNKLGCDSIVAVGTAVFRQASNGHLVKELLEKSLGHKIKIISENDEAILIANGISTFELNLPDNYLLLDIGGRSSEVSFVENACLRNSLSFPLGAISIRSDYFKENKPTLNEIENTNIEINNTLANGISPFINKSELLIGSSGTLRMLSRFFKLTNPHEQTIPANYLEEVFEILYKDQNKNLIKDLLALEKNRTELIFSGLLLVNSFIKQLGIKNIKVSNYSLRHGILKRLIDGKSL